MSINPAAIRILIVEDEPIISRDIERRLKDMGYEVTGIIRDGLGAVDRARDDAPDVVLMDIKLKDGPSGIMAARTIRQDLCIPVIFLTANSDEATVSKARLAEPYGFVVKPFSDPALRTAIEIALAHHEEEMRVLRERDRLYSLMEEGSDQEYLFVKSKGRQIRLRMRDITYLEALKDYVGIHVGGQRYVIHSTLQDLEGRVSARQFLRIHRSFIVRLDKIQTVEDGQVTLEHEAKPVPIGGSYVGKVRERLDPL
ncbi:MAG: LytR/AlgR family response regulator transcription factor [Flavobacteriales bacterium]|jgi:DNA-binding LytR/AlgR family response regulator